MGLGVVLYKQVYANTDVTSALQALKINIIHNRFWFVVVLLLTISNWTLETIKWRFLVNRISRIKFLSAFLGVLLGIAFSLFTPNRLGEYGGRVLVLRENRIAAIVSTLIGSFSQIVINMSVGGLAVLFFLWKYLSWNAYLTFTTAIIYCILLALLLISYFNIDLASTLFKRYSIFKKISVYVDVVKRYSQTDLLFLLGMSSLRYMTYCVQFILLLKIFDTGIKVLDGLVLVPTVFFAQGILPTMAIFDVSLRGQVALSVISEHTSGAMFQVVASSITLWFVNLIVPSILGGVLALFFRFRD